ncbi:MAG: GIY-YIG nuclease family protein [Candidatus Gracilibacteria bacterium]|nr:GIY-YIG nuclease family protein [Candidatus Gracilibacteria bacterium]MDD2908209.1 GIY-YIG nuclease family protein [Candidatus Gracilibacteria bacterium]
MITNTKYGVLYIGVTNNLERRLYEHKNKIFKGFSSKYNLNKLVYFEEYGEIESAIIREKELKKWRREKKIDLIESKNIFWKDLSENWNY